MLPFFAGIGVGIEIIAMLNPIPESPPPLELYHPYSCYDSKFFWNWNSNWNHQILKNEENPIPELVPVRTGPESGLYAQEMMPSSLTPFSGQTRPGLHKKHHLSNI